MNRLESFALQNGFQKTETGFAGVYCDMFLSLSESDGRLNAYLFLDLPGGARKNALLGAVREKAERYAFTVEEGENRKFLAFSFEHAEDALSRMERCLSECDTLLRPYGREMGVLCSACRSEIKEEAPKIIMENGIAVPVCAACLQNPTAHVVKHKANRKSVVAKRARMGMMGALIGMLIVIPIWAFLSVMGVSGYYLPAIIMPFIVDRFYMKFGGISDKWRMAVVSLFTIAGMLLGETAGYAYQLYDWYDAVMKAAEAEGAILETISFWEYFSAGLSVKDFIIGQLPNIVFALIGAYASTNGGVFKRRM